MQKLLTLLCVTTLGLSACGGEKDKAYYLSNLDKAEAKKSECEAEIKAAAKAKDATKFEKIRTDKECIAAHDALKEHRIAQAEKERLEKEQALKAALAEERKKIEAELGQKTWQDVVHFYVNNECSRKLYPSKEDLYCHALKGFYDDKAEQGKNELMKYSLDELFAEQKNYCTRDKRRFSACDIWEKAVAEQALTTFTKLDLLEMHQQQKTYCEFNSPKYAACKSFGNVMREKQKVVIDEYAKNYEKLKTDYNQCVLKMREFGDDYSRYQERLAVENSYPCFEAQQTRINLGLGFDPFKTLME